MSRRVFGQHALSEEISGQARTMALLPSEAARRKRLRAETPLRTWPHTKCTPLRPEGSPSRIADKTFVVLVAGSCTSQLHLVVEEQGRAGPPPLGDPAHHT